MVITAFQNAATLSEDNAIKVFASLYSAAYPMPWYVVRVQGSGVKV
jgi:hypothetical protein